MSLIDRIVASPADWTGTQVIDELAAAHYDEGDRRRDPVLPPPWLRERLVVCDFDTHLQMEGFLGWWENAASEDLRLVADALRFGVGCDLNRHAAIGRSARVRGASLRREPAPTGGHLT